jgi:hypothetical protein
MSFDPNHEQQYGELQEHVRQAVMLSPELFAEVTARACLRFQACPAHAQGKVRVLVDTGARLDAALALLTLELPQWKLRRLVYESGEWLCTLSQRPELPIEIDDVIEAVHDNAPLAILSALIEASHLNVTSGQTRPTSVPRIGALQGHMVCCDDFA